MPPVNKKPQPTTKQPGAGKKPGNNNTKTIVIVLVCVVVAAAVIAFFVHPPFRDFFRKSPAKTAVEAPAPEEVAEDVPPVEEAPAEELQPQKQESSSSVSKGFYVNVGSFRDQRNAERLVKNCSKDIELEVLYFNEIGYYRVSAGHYDNIHKAYNDKYSIKDLDNCENAWVLENR